MDEDNFYLNGILKRAPNLCVRACVCIITNNSKWTLKVSGCDELIHGQLAKEVDSD